MGSRHLSSRPFGTRSFAVVPGSELPGYSRMSLRDVTRTSKLQGPDPVAAPTPGHGAHAQPGTPLVMASTQAWVAICYTRVFAGHIERPLPLWAEPRGIPAGWVGRNERKKTGIDVAGRRHQVLPEVVICSTAWQAEDFVSGCAGLRIMPANGIQS
jgi:hypothetical protein